MIKTTIIAIVFVLGSISVNIAGYQEYEDESEPVGRILGGFSSPVSSRFPYQVSIQLNSIHHCGGSVISNFWILTAGHCIYGIRPENFVIVIGTNDIANGGTYYRVVQPILHEGYQPDPKLVNDIALLRVDRPITFGVNVQPVRLASRPLPTGSPCLLTGWGWVDLMKTIPHLLQFIDQRLVDINQCKRAFIGKPHTVRTDTNICAINAPGRGTCHADSGSPLVCNGIQYGIASTGDACAKGIPDVYTAIHAYRRWIAVKAGV